MKNCGSCNWHDRETSKCHCVSCLYYGERTADKCSPCYRWTSWSKHHKKKARVRKMANRVSITATIGRDVNEQLTTFSKKTAIPKSRIIDMALVEFLEKYKDGYMERAVD